MNAFNTKVSKSKQGPLRFPKHDKPLELSYAETKMNKKQLKEYLETGKLPQEVEEKLKKKRGRPKMKPEQAQELEKKVNQEMEEVKQSYTDYGAELELQKLEQEVVELSNNNVKLQNELDDLLSRYNNLMEDYLSTEQLRYDLTRLEGQLSQVRTAKKETEDILTEETNKREALERLVRLYV